METQMSKTQILIELRFILNKLDCDRDSIITREKSSKHDDEVQVLLQHIKILIADLMHDNQALRCELFDMRRVIEDEGDMIG